MALQNTFSIGNSSRKLLATSWSTYGCLDCSFNQTEVRYEKLRRLSLYVGTCFVKCISSSPISFKKFEAPEPKRWLPYNDKVFPPQEYGEERRPAYVCHMKTNIRYSYKKLWYIAVLIRGLQIEEALNQLKFIKKKGATAVIETLEEARELALKEHNVEFASNLWVAESFVGKGFMAKGARRHARGRLGEIRYSYTHYLVRLEEGSPPKEYYYWNRTLTPQEKLDNWLQEKRERTIPFTI